MEKYWLSPSVDQRQSTMSGRRSGSAVAGPSGGASREAVEIRPHRQRTRQGRDGLAAARFGAKRRGQRWFA